MAITKLETAAACRKILRGVELGAFLGFLASLSDDDLALPVVEDGADAIVGFLRSMMQGEHMALFPKLTSPSWNVILSFLCLPLPLLLCCQIREMPESQVSRVVWAHDPLSPMSPMQPCEPHGDFILPSHAVPCLTLLPTHNLI